MNRVIEDGPLGSEATALLRQAGLIVVTISALCEFVWVLRRIYTLTPPRSASRSERCARHVRWFATG